MCPQGEITRSINELKYIKRQIEDEQRDRRLNTREGNRQPHKYRDNENEIVGEKMEKD